MLNTTGTGQRLYQRARQIIPGGTQLLSKRPEMFLPEQWPAYFSQARGAEVQDLDGRSYIDMSHCGVGAPILGYADAEVDEAVLQAVRSGVASSLNCPEEVALAELLIELHPWAEMARFARSGGEIMAIAIRIARAATGRDKVAFCGYHGWADWYLAANLSEERSLDGHLLPGLAPKGVPRGLSGTSIPFRYNAIEELRTIVAEHGDKLAAIVMEPARSAGPAPGFLEEVRALATKSGAVLIFDEITSGWRMNTGGIHLTYGVNPDLATFAKGMANGYAMAALIGIRNVMEAAQSSFISSTNWTERIGPAAALATIRKHRRERVGNYLVHIGQQVQEGWKKAAEATGNAIKVYGIPPLSGFSFEHAEPMALATYFVQEMLARGYIASPAFYAMFAHTEEIVAKYLGHVTAVFQGVAQSIKEGNVQSRLKGPVKHSGFQRLT